MAKKRVGIFGGTFDPPHLGHLLLAESIREDFDLDEVLFVPCHEPPHKDRPDLTGATHRYAMVVAATLHNQAFIPSAVEVNRNGRSYSIDTVRTLRSEFGEDTELYFVAGLDSFLQIQSWKSYEELLDLAHFVVISRPNNSFEGIHEVLPERFHDRVVDVRRGRTSGDERPAVSPDTATGLRTYLSDAVFLDVSSTEIRARVRGGLGIRYRVTQEVDRYIRSHGLYTEARTKEAAS